MSAISCAYCLGSSPLARGGHVGRDDGAQVVGLIPRSRGADETPNAPQVLQTGSSPLARGGPRHHLPRPVRHGLIPARAGRTVLARRQQHTERAHPRSREADITPTSPTTPARGSSPLARGGLFGVPFLPVPLGLIPARAGRTCPCPSTLRTERAHPRSRGADPKPLKVMHSERGSSPLARGGRCDCVAHGDPQGLIPARAGRTFPSTT